MKDHNKENVFNRQRDKIAHRAVRATLSSVIPKLFES
jgi:hypothetical protein